MFKQTIKPKTDEKKDHIIQIPISKYYPEGYKWKNELPGGKTKLIPQPVSDKVK